MLKWFVILTGTSLRKFKHNEQAYTSDCSKKICLKSTSNASLHTFSAQLTKRINSNVSPYDSKLRMYRSECLAFINIQSLAVNN